MKERVPGKRIDPELLLELDRAEAGEEAVQVICYLRSPDPAKVVAEPGETELLANRVLGRVARESGTVPHEVHVFRNMGSFAVDASPKFVRALIGQDEVAAAIANRRR